MKNEFAKNDKLIFTASVIADMLLYLSIILGLIWSIITIVEGASAINTAMIIIGILMIPLTFILAFIYWVFIKIFINLCCDIKLIRNKQYSIDNEYLTPLVANKQERDAESTDFYDRSEATYTDDMSSSFDNQSTAKIEKLKEWKSLLDNDIITVAEFEKEKQRILNT